MAKEIALAVLCSGITIAPDTPRILLIRRGLAPKSLEILSNADFIATTLVFKNCSELEVRPVVALNNLDYFPLKA
jgi:hypothetical protein